MGRHLHLPERALKQGTFVLVLAVVLLPLGHLIYPPGRDQAAFVTCAQLLAAGKALYRDCWDVKGPLTYLAVRAFIDFPGPPWLAVRVLDVLAVWATSVLLYTALPFERAIRWSAALLWEWLYLNLNYWNTAQPEGFALPLILAAILVWAIAPAPRWPRPFLAGVLLGVAGGFKPTALVTGALALVLCRPPWRSPRQWFIWAVGVMVSTGLWFGWLYSTGSLTPYLEILGFLAAPYQQTPHPSRWVNLIWANRWLLKNERLLPTLLALLAIPTARSTRKGQALLALGISGLLSVHLQGRYWAYHWVYLLPALAGLALWGWWELRSRLSPYMASVFMVGMFGIAFLYLPSELPATLKVLLQGAPLERAFPAYGTYGRGHFSLQGDWEVAQFLSKRSRAQDRIWVWGFEPAIYLFAERRPATRFIYDLPLSIDVANPWTPRWQQEALQVLRRSPPRYIVVATQDVTAVEREDSRAQLRYFPALARWLQRTYILETQVERFLIYRRKGGDGEG